MKKISVPLLFIFLLAVLWYPVVCKATVNSIYFINKWEFDGAYTFEGKPSYQYREKVTYDNTKVPGEINEADRSYYANYKGRIAAYVYNINDAEIPDLSTVSTNGYSWPQKVYEFDVYDETGQIHGFGQSSIWSNIPAFTNKLATEQYVKTGVIDREYLYEGTVPDGYTIDGEGNIVVQKEIFDKNLGIPLEFKYFVPGMWGQPGKAPSPNEVLQNAWLYKNNLHEFKAQWKNKEKHPNYKVQIEYKGKYKAKKNNFSQAMEVETEYIQLDEVPANTLRWSKDEMYVDRGVQALVYLQIVELMGFKPHLESVPVIWTSMKQLNGSMRIRYVKYVDDKMYYGRWARATINEDGSSITVEADKDDNPIESEEYGKGEEYTPEDFDNTDYVNGNAFKKVVGNIDDLQNLVGQVPQVLAKIMSFLPAEVWTIIVIGIALMVAIAVIKTLF